MAKSKNQRIYSNPEHLLMLVDEQENFIGREYKLELSKGLLTIYALPQRHKKSFREKEKKDERNKRAESAARRS